MKPSTKKTKTGKCEFCSSEGKPEICKLSAATIIIEGKEYTACCVKCAGGHGKKNRKKKGQKS